MPHAIRIHAPGGPDVMQWEEVAVGEPGPGEARVRHTAVGVNYIDTYHRGGLYKLPLPAGIGSEAAGVVEAVGSGVTWVKAGDRVAYCGGAVGSYSEVRVMPAERLVKLPDGITDRVAATLMLKGLTVQYLFRQTYRLKEGETILFQAAAGGVGLIACQWARALGVTMIGTVGSDDKAALAKAHGCAHTIVYTRENFVERVKALTGGKGVPVVYDGVGKDTFPASLDCLSPRGMFVSYGNASGPVPPLDILMLTAKGSLYADTADARHLHGDARSHHDDGEGALRPRARGQDQERAAADVPAARRRRRAPRARVARDDRRDRAFALTDTAILRRQRAEFRRSRATGASSAAVNPTGPRRAATQASAAAPCKHTASRSAVTGSMRCARKAPTNPARTSPVPADASAGLPVALTSQRPSRCASTLPAPLSTTDACSLAAISSAAAMRSDCTSLTDLASRRPASAG